MNIKKYLPTKENVYHFISNFTLLIITLSVGHYYINNRLQKINRSEIIQQELINQQTNFIKNFVKLGQSKIYQAENYYNNNLAKENQTVLIRSWENYMYTVKLWNKENLLNPIYIKLYFGNEMQNEFYNNLLPKLIILHESLLKIRDEEKVDNMEQIIENAKHELFIFSEKMIYKQKS